MGADASTVTVEALDVMLQTEREDAPGKTVSWQGEVDARVKSRAGLLEETAGELEVPAATKPSTTVPPELSRRSSSEPTLLGRHNQHYRTRILEELGPPSSTMWLNLDRINRTLCGLPDKRKSLEPLHDAPRKPVTFICGWSTLVHTVHTVEGK